MKTEKAIKEEIKCLDEISEVFNVMRVVEDAKKKTGKPNATVISRHPLEEYCKKYDIDMHKPISDFTLGYCLGSRAALEWALR